MISTKSRVKACLAAAVMVAAGSVLVSDALAKAPPSGDPASWVVQRVQLWQPTAGERRFDDIGWASDILEARRLGKEHRRPIFLFTHDGHMAVGRC